MQEKEYILRVQDLKTDFKVGRKTVHAVNGVTFDVQRGKTLCIVGESGCGKSVTAHSIMQLLPPNGMIAGGSIAYYTQSGGCEKLSEYKRNGSRMRAIRGKEISMIFQDPMSTLNPVYTVGSQIMEMLKKHEKVDKAEGKTRIIRLLGELGIPNPEIRYDQYPHEFSGGMKQRIMIAIAMICNPTLLIADEPTTALDVTIQAQILELMKKLQKTNQMGIIFITHNLGVVAEICDKVSVMYAGKMVEQGPVDDIFYAPGHPYTRGLLRSMPRVDAESYERLIPIEGTPVDMLNPPEGCPFAPRCESAMKICLQKMPPYVELGDNHRAACWLCVQEQMKAQKAAEKNNEKTEAGSHE